MVLSPETREFSKEFGTAAGTALRAGEVTTRAEADAMPQTSSTATASKE